MKDGKAFDLVARILELSEDQIPLFGVAVMAFLDEGGNIKFHTRCVGESYKYQIHGLLWEVSKMIDAHGEDEMLEY
jgi:hypothetical protein